MLMPVTLARAQTNAGVQPSRVALRASLLNGTIQAGATVLAAGHFAKNNSASMANVPRHDNGSHRAANGQRTEKRGMRDIFAVLGRPRDPLPPSPGVAAAGESQGLARIATSWIT